MIKHLLAAAAVSALMTGAALAQDAPAMPPADTAASPEAAAADAAAPADAASTSADTAVNPGAAPAAGAATTPVSSPADSTMAKAGDPGVTTNGPVPDTAENRAKYGKPLSNAGKRSAAKGN